MVFLEVASLRDWHRDRFENMLICCRHRCGEFHFSQKEIGNGKEIQYLSQGQKRCSFDSHIFMIF